MKTTIDCTVGVDLPSAGVYICISTTFLNRESGYFTHCIELKDGDEPSFGAIIFTEEDNMTQYIKSKCRCSFRAEIVDRENLCVLVNMSVLNLVNTLDKEDDIKLCLDKLPESKSTIAFEEVTPDNPVNDCIVYISAAEYRRNKKTDWFVFTLVDRNGRMAKCRMFRPEDPEAKWAGFYARGDLSCSEWGLQSEILTTTPTLDSWHDPSIDVCVSFMSTILDRLPTNWATQLRSSRFLESLHKNDADLELYEVSIACHLAMDMNNVSNIVSTDRILRAICAKYLYKMAAKENDLLSDTITSAMVMVKFGLTESGTLNILDTESNKVYLDNEIALKLIDIAKLIVTTERCFNIDSKVIAWK